MYNFLDSLELSVVLDEDDMGIDLSPRSEIKKEFGRDIDDLWLSDTPKKTNALFKTANEQAYPISPCNCFFVGKPRAGKTIYFSYAVNRWRNNEEAFGLIPTAEIRPVCISRKKIDGIECMDPFRFTKYDKSHDSFMKLIEYICVCHKDRYNVILIDNSWMLVSNLYYHPHSMSISEQLSFIGDILSQLSSKLEIYFFLSVHPAKRNIHDTGLGTSSLDECFVGASYITETTDSHIDLLFDWRTKKIKRRVMFGDLPNELIPETDASLYNRLEEEQYEKYYGYEVLRTLLLQFKDGPVNVRSVKSSMKMVMKILKAAKEDGYLLQDCPRGSYRLSEKGNEIISIEDSA